MPVITLFRAASGLTFTADAAHVTTLTVTSGAATGVFHPKPFDIPAGWVKDGRLLTWTDIQAEIAEKRAQGEALAVDALEEARDKLRADLAGCKVDLTAAAGGFLGINGLPLAAAATTAHIAINLMNLVPEADREAVVFEAEIAAVGVVNTPHGTRGASFRIEVRLTHGGLVTLLPSVSVEALPGLPALDLHWPKVAWGGLDWANLGLPDLEQFLRLRLPIPRVAGPPFPLRVEWTGAPQFAATVDAARRLSFGTAGPSSGDLIYDVDGNQQQLAQVRNFAFSLQAGGNLSVQGTISATAKPPPTITLRKAAFDRPEILPFEIDIAAPVLEVGITAEIDLSVLRPGAAITATLILPRVQIRAKADPALLLTLSATYEQEADPVTGATSGRLTRLEVIEPYPVKLVALAAETAADAVERLIRLVSAIPVPTVGSGPGLGGVLDRLVAMAAAAILWLETKAGAAVEALLGAAQAAVDLLADLLKALRNRLGGLNGPGLLPHIVIELQLDSRTYALRRILLSPASPIGLPELEFGGAALSLTVPAGGTLALVIDFDGPTSVSLLATPPAAGAAIVLATDLWLKRSEGSEAVRDTNASGARPPKRLISVSASFPNAGAVQSISLVRLSAGHVSFFEAMTGPGAGANLAWVDIPGATPLRIVQAGAAIAYERLTADIAVETDFTEARRLPFLQSAGDALSQYIEIAPGAPGVWAGDKYRLTLNATLKIDTTSTMFPLEVLIDPRTLQVSLETPDTIVIEGPDPTKPFSLLGLKGEIKAAKIADKRFAIFALDFSKGDVRLSLAPDAKLELSYGKVAAGGKGLVFVADTLSMYRGGLDLDAHVDPNTPVTLAGVGMPFRFDGGALSIKRSEIQAFSIHGTGQLPPELVGEANATVTISMGRDARGALTVQSAEALLDKSNDPFVCHTTWFDVSLTAVGFEFHDFSAEGGGYHFYFTLTGSAAFRPRAGQFSDGLLKNLGGVKITLDKVPLARDASMLARAIKFQVAVQPPKTFNLFNLFTFELRGIGFQPASPAFGGKPAMSVSGQAAFADFGGDIPLMSIQAHEILISGPKNGDWVPQVRFEGLTLGIRFGSAVSIEGTALAVDDTMPTLFKPGVLPANVTPRGFLASGKLSIKGWASMSASMGFLELERKDAPPRKAFFLYAQQNELSYEIPTPVGPIYLREVGFGFGFRYTLAAFNRADQVHSVKDLITTLDDISRYQGDLASVKSWEPEPEGNRLTLALRGLITVASASSETNYNKKGETELSNPVLFDVVAALRSDLTFFMTARVWLCFNYEDWNKSTDSAPWRTRPTLRGYTYLSVPRQEFLARMIADGSGEIGAHPQLPKELITAMKGLRWSATTYIRPGLFHQEFGWPYELGYTLRDGDKFELVCEGGLVQRIEDGAMLFGMAFRARGWAKFGGSVGGRSFGASVTAKADFSIDAKLIAYVSVARGDDTLFYGSIAFNASISLEVRIWLEFSVGPWDVHLDIGFSATLTISIALEIAATPSSIAGRGSASVGVSGFGRSLHLGIGVEFNKDALVAARARVQRFLTLGLTVETPDPEKAVAAPAASLPRGPKAAQADQALEETLDKQKDYKAPVAAAPSPVGRPLVQSGYWAMLFAVPDGESYVMAFLPRDHSGTGLPTGADLPKATKTELRLGSFYPPSSQGLQITGGPASAVQAYRLLPGGKTEPVVIGATSPAIPISYDAVRIVARKDAKELKLGDFLALCFINTDKGLAEPYERPIQVARERLPEGREAAAQVLAEAGRDHLDLNAEQRAGAAIEERRSAAIASFGESAARLAAGGEEAWEPAAQGLDIRALGLAFVVKKSDIDALFAPATESGGPRRANFELSSDPAGAPDGPSVHLFNAPEQMFDECGPRFADPVIEATASGIRLDWDLEPAFGKSEGVWWDPEFRLKHYRIERTITGESSLEQLTAPRTTTTKAAAPIKLARDPVTGAFGWRLIRPNAQFIDDLADLPEAVRVRALPGGPQPQDKTETDPLVAAFASGAAVLRYVVTPVDIAGTEGVPTNLTLRPQARQAIRPGVRQAILKFDYIQPALADFDDAAAAEPLLTLGLDDPIPKDKWVLAGPKRVYRLRVRPERGVATGLYGADAVTEARVRPSPEDFARRRPDDADFLLERPGAETPTIDARLSITKKNNDPTAFKLLQGDGSDGAWAKLLEAIGVSTTSDKRAASGPLGVRFAIQPVVEAGTADPPWLPVEMVLRLGPAATKPEAKTGEDEKVEDRANPEDLALPIEVFEHPLAINPAPLLRDDMQHAKAGQVYVLYPSADGTLADLLSEAKRGRTAEEFLPKRLPDPARRVGTRLQWNVLPSAADAIAGNNAASRLGRFFAGFNIFELDAGAEAEGALTPPGAADMPFRFSLATTVLGKGMIQIDVDAQGTPTAIRLSTDDADGKTRGLLLDSFATGVEGGRIRLVHDTKPDSWIEFDLLGRFALGGARKLIVARTRTSAKPFKAGDRLRMIYLGPTGARYVGKVQALPPTMARLDPAEIEDFSKVEARYPSDTRLVDRHGAPRAGVSDTARRAPWYSPADSFAVWPERTPRRSLAINLDEAVLTQVFAKGRPDAISISLTIGQYAASVTAFQAGTANPVFVQTGASFAPRGVSGWSARTLRQLLQALVLVEDEETRRLFNADPALFQAAEVTLSARVGQTPLVSVKWTVDLDPPLHPVLADVIDWAGYEATPVAFLPRLMVHGVVANGDARSAGRKSVGFAFAGWPARAGVLKARDAAVAAPELLFRRGGALSQAVLEIDDDAKGLAQVQSVIEESLATRLSAAARTAVRRHYETAPEDFGALRLEVTLTAVDGKKWALPGLAIDPGSLWADAEATVYRRYEPVLEAPPRSSARDVSAWLDETPAKRDLHGWAVLRRMGLATGLRLFDTETNEYLSPRQTLARLNEAFARILPRYASNVGAPFVDLIARPGGLTSVASFDGGSSAVTPVDVTRLFDDEALALTQISLRPTPDRWAKPAMDRPVAYFLVTADPGPLTISLPKTAMRGTASGVIGVLEILDRTYDLAAPPIVTLATPPAVPGREDPADTRLRRELTGMDGVGSTHVMNVPVGADPQVALIRVTVSSGDAATLGKTWLGDQCVLHEVEAPGDQSGAFGRFPDMAPLRFEALATPGDHSRRAGHPSIRAAIGTWRSYVERVFPKSGPADPGGEASLVARLPEWTRRFLDHGAAKPPAGAALVALAEIARPDPWRVGVGDDGQMHILLPHEDRRRRLKRYMIEPYGRYDNLAEALRKAGGQGGAASQAPRDYLPIAPPKGDLQKDWGRRFQDVVIPRTEPLAPPVLIDAKRVESHSAEGKVSTVLEFTYARHSEEILSEANVSVEGALSFESMAVGLWREFPRQGWAHALKEDIDTLQGFGDLNSRKANPLLAGPDNFAGLARGDDLKTPGRYTDGWRGVTVIRTDSLPFFYRIHALAFASAGVVVSKPVIGSVPEGFYELHLPWKEPLFGRTTPPPRWSVVRNGTGADAGAYVVFALPLVRLVDGMPVHTRGPWLQDGTDIPEVFTLPDPDVRYEIGLRAADSSGASAVSTELELASEHTRGVPRYSVNLVGPRFDDRINFQANPPPAILPPAAIVEERDDRIWWRTDPRAPLRPERLVSPSVFAPPVEDTSLERFELPPAAFAQDGVWSKMTATTDAKVILSPPVDTPAAWADFKADAAVWRDLVQPYAAGSPAAASIAALLSEAAANASLAWWKAKGWVAADGHTMGLGTVAAPGFAAGLPHLPDGRPGLIAIVPSSWRWPAAPDTGVDARELIRAVGPPTQTAPGFSAHDFEAGVRDVIRREMRRHAIAGRAEAAVDGFSWRNPAGDAVAMPAFSAPIPEGLKGPALAMIQADKVGAPAAPECVDVIVKVPVSATAANHPRVIDLIRTLEAASFSSLTLGDLAGLEDGAAVADPGDLDQGRLVANVHLPASALRPGPVRDALDTLVAVVAEKGVVALLLRAPPDDPERAGISAAIGLAGLTAPAQDDLRAFVNRATAQQVFGRDHEPMVKAYHGRADPASAIISPAVEI